MHVPPELKTGREELSSEKKNGDLVLVLSSYIVGTSKAMKKVIVLAMVQPLTSVTKDDGKQKPAIFKLYEFTKGGTDVVDKMSGTYTAKSKSPKWTEVSFRTSWI